MVETIAGRGRKDVGELEQAFHKHANCEPRFVIKNFQPLGIAFSFIERV